MKISAYAKLNLALNITGTTENGYHTLDMIMQEISLCDFIDIKKADTVSIKASTYLPRENTMSKACTLFFEYTGIKGGANINIKKNIPIGAGLGGGSSDGAAVLKALNELYNAQLSQEELIKIGLKIGADVPFFIKGGCMRARGIGEKLDTLENNLDCTYILAKPKKGVNTAKAYGVFDEIGGETSDIKKVTEAMKNGDIKEFSKYAKNSLTYAGTELCPEINEILTLLGGADHVMMSGSGSCCFAVYENKKAAEEKLRSLEKSDIIDFLWSGK